MPSSWPEPPRRETPPAPHSWPEAPAADAPTSWPEPPRQAPEPSWPEPPRKDPSWPEPPGATRQAPARPDAAAYNSGPRDAGSYNSGPHDAGRHGAEPSWPDQSRPEPARPGQQRGAGWPESSPQNGPISSWPEPNSQDVPMSWPDATPPPQSAAGPGAWPEVSSKGAPPPGQAPNQAPAQQPGQQPGQPADPVPAWALPPTPTPGAWSNLSNPAPWPPADQQASTPPAERTVMYGNQSTPRQDMPPPPQQQSPPHDQPPIQPQSQNHPADERTVTYTQHTENLLNERAVPSTSMDSPHTGTPPAEDQSNRPGSQLSRDPSDPEHRFVTAGQISGSRTPPPERQQELWNTVFGDNYQAMGEQDDLDEGSGKPVWVYALGGSVAVALVAALLWAFLWGPLAPDDAASAGEAAATASEPKEPPPTKTATSIGPLPRYPGKASPVTGRLPVANAGISVPRLGGEWQLDQRPAVTIKGTYNFMHRQYVQVAPERYAVLMAGPLQEKMASYYEQDNLEPVIKQVVLDARKRFFPTGNKVRKVAQQAIKVGDQTGRLIAYSLTSDTEKATIVTMAVNTGADVPAIVFMSIPADKKQLLPDIRTVMNQIRLTNAG
ncbi:hypothetical protein ABZW11_05765 [Nonomuraea sp. NPDC004580]|uniref:hypothetical protein n=1 Tax=Nonomuraea sp. NPDC004580 TaxID=3154552 RepID=UPI0033A108F0